MSTQQSAANESLMAQERKIAADIGHIVDGATDALKTFTTQTLENADQTLQNAQHAATDAAKKYAGMTDGFVRTNPWAAIGAAAAVGLLAGMLIARR